jgi:hypothetical protein
MHTINRLLLWIWALWLSVVALTNACDALKALGLLPKTFSFASGNYGFIQSVTAIHHTPTFVVAGLFAGVIAWEVVGAVLHWRAALQPTPAAVSRAFLVSIALWGAFMLADEVFISYDVEGTHLHLLIAGLVSVLVLARGGLVEPATTPAG